MNRTQRSVSWLSVSALLALSACTHSKEGTKASVADNASAKVNVLGAAPKANANSEDPVKISASITLNKSAVLGPDFFYNVDLQYSSYHDPGMDLYNQSEALGLIPVKFRVSGKELQLISDEKRSYPSDVNHPELLISRFKILNETATQFTVSEADSSLFLGQTYVGTMSTPIAAPPQDHWARSFEFDPNGNYLLQQSSIIASNGDRAEFMETIFPAANLKPGANFVKIQMDPASTPSAMSAFDGRFRVLPGESIYDPSTSTPQAPVYYGTHFDLSPNADGTPASIDWYVTRNIPKEDLAPVKMAVEGWNRYFKTFKGFPAQVMNFKGTLPDGIHLGDARYNVINWDSISEAGAAYESQTSDPFTGKQTHSVIYMPAAWLNLGAQYWNAGGTSDSSQTAPAVKARNAAPIHARIACTRDVREGLALATSGKLTAAEVSQFGTELLKQVLFHEVGHSLGLAHNFKGSLSFDRSNPKSLFSNSIMDYNDFEIERAAFTSVDTADGPQLPYDRQVLDAIYNKSADIGTEKMVPVCTDDEADNEAGGVDPLCNRYDIEIDPTLSVDTALSRVNSTTLPNDVTLTQALTGIQDSVLTPDFLSKAKSAEDMVTALVNGIQGSLDYYFVFGKSSVEVTTKLNIKSLLQFEDNALSDSTTNWSYNEAAMRERAFNGVQQVINMQQLPGSVIQAIQNDITAGFKLIANTPVGQSESYNADPLNQNVKTALEQALGWATNATTTFTGGGYATGVGLPYVRAALLKALARHPAVPFFFGSIQNVKHDYETQIVQLLEQVTEDNATPTRVIGERLAAATSLMTFKDRSGAANLAISTAKSKAQAELQNSMDNTSRENAEKVLMILSP